MKKKLVIMVHDLINVKLTRKLIEIACAWCVLLICLILFKKIIVDNICAISCNNKNIALVQKS